jgi:hypothetical protein
VQLDLSPPLKIRNEQHPQQSFANIRKKNEEKKGQEKNQTK